MFNSVIKPFLVFMLFLPLPFHTVATVWDSDAIEKLALDYLIEHTPEADNSKLNFSILPIDPRIKIKPCSMPLNLKVTDKNKRKKKHIEVTCPDANTWKMYLKANVEITYGVVIAVNALAKGALITSDDVELAYLAEHKVRGIKFQNTSQAIGSKAKKRISKGKAINQNDICMICKGDTVMIIAKTGGLEIKTQGIEKSTGNIYQQISVVNKRSGKLITAQVKSLNKVIINL